MNRISCFLLVALGAFSIPSTVLAQTAKPATAKQQVMIEGVGAIEVTTITASIEAVDQKNRVVTLKGPRGNVFAIPVSDRVKNLPQVKAGDIVELNYYEAIAVEVKKSEGAPTLTETSAAGKAKEGQMPAGVAMRKVRVVTNVLGINTESQSVLVRGPLGHLTEVKVKDPKVLAGLKSGGQIDLTYLEGVAIEVRSGAKKK
jgi:hypothetical protein